MEEHGTGSKFANMAERNGKASSYDDFDMEEYSYDGQDSLQNEKRSRCAKVGDGLVAAIGYVYDRIPLRHVCPALVLVLYTIFGGWLFRCLELPATGTRIDKEYENMAIIAELFNESLPQLNISEISNRIRIRKQLADRIWEIMSDQSIMTDDRDKLLEDMWNWYDNASTWACAEVEESPEVKWSWWNSMFFAATLYTTIGYGNIAPSTTAGRIATMIYAIVGIPMVLTILSSWGHLLFKSLRGIMRLYVKLKHRRSVWVPMADLPEGIDDLPVALAVFLLIFWIGGCAAIFLIWEHDWTYFTSLYFFFISLTTIGLGDVVPAYPQYTLMSFILVLLGLSVVSMSFNIIQIKVENVFKSMMLGIEQEYWHKQVEPESSKFGDDGVHASVGIMQLWKKKPLRDRILFRLMDKSKKDMLQAYWEKKANTRNQSTQTTIKTFANSLLQVDMEEEELKTKYKNRKYVYNLCD